MVRSSQDLNEIEVYKLNIHLSEAFKTSQSSIQVKTTYMYHHRIKDRVIELPYSPSMGESPDRILGDCELVKRTLSWLDFDLSQLSIPLRQDRFKMQTFGIGQEVSAKPELMIKLKADHTTVAQIASESKKFKAKNIPWFVDFNQGLSPVEWDSFLNEVDLSTCFGIEQPLSRGQITGYHCQIAPVILDEEMSDITQEKLIELRPKAVVLKPWRYTWQQYKVLHDFLIQENIPYMVGSMIQGPVADHMCDQLNIKAPIQYSQTPKVLDLKMILQNAEFVGKLKIF